MTCCSSYPAYDTPRTLAPRRTGTPLEHLNDTADGWTDGDTWTVATVMAGQPLKDLGGTVGFLAVAAEVGLVHVNLDYG